MCEPTTIISLAGTLIGGFMQFRQQQAQAAHAQAQARNARLEAEYRAEIHQNNATRAEFLAQDAIARGKEAEADERTRGRLVLGQLRAAFAGSGQVVDEGSAGQVIDDQAAQGEVNARTVRRNFALEAQEFRIRGQQFESDAGLTRFAGENRARDFEAQSQASESSAFGTLLGTGAKVATKWYEYSRVGAVP